MDETSKPEPAPRVKSAARAIEALLVIAKSKDGCDVSDLVREMNVSRQSVYHLLHTLEQIEAVRKDANRRYVFGYGMLPIVTSCLRQFTPQDVLSPIVNYLAQVSGETAYAAAWLGGDVAIIASSTRAQRLRSPVMPLGTLGDTHARASGKLLLSMMSNAEIQDFLDTHTLTARTRNTITAETAFWEEIEQIRENGYATDLGEYMDATCCVALPFFPMPDYVIAISAPTRRFKENFETYLAVLRECSNKI